MKRMPLPQVPKIGSCLHLGWPISRKYLLKKLTLQQAIGRYLCQLRWIILMTENRACLPMLQRSRVGEPQKIV